MWVLNNLMTENEKKIKMLKEKINQIKRLGDKRNWYNLTDSEKENALNHERRWKDKRITEIMQEIRKLKGK
tara:strand:+ start:2722 stop:2934 length:213 start_codon:yes stop_codon:yes gene_type:complete